MLLSSSTAFVTVVSLSFVVRRLFVVRRPSFVVRRSSFVVRRSSFVVGHSFKSSKFKKCEQQSFIITISHCTGIVLLSIFTLHQYCPLTRTDHQQHSIQLI